MYKIFPEKQYILWGNLVCEKAGKSIKTPVNASGIPVNAHDPENWLSYEEATRYTGRWGLGFVLTPDDPYFFIDIDACLQTDGSWSPLVENIIKRFPGAFVEVSTSKTGVHVIGSYDQNPPKHGNKNGPWKIELYTKFRFVALTGFHATGDPSLRFDTSLANFIREFFPPRASSGASAWSDGPVDDWKGPECDQELLKIALVSKSSLNALGRGVTFRHLWEGDETVLGDHFPSPSGDVYDRSSADLSLLTRLAFFTGKDHGRMDRMFRMSALGRREKWEREDYRVNSISQAIASCHKVYYNSKYKSNPGDEGPEDGTVVGSRFLDIHSQKELFKDCVYVVGQHKVLVGRYGLLGPDPFKAWFGGYGFAVRSGNAATKNAFEAFTENQLYDFKKAHSTCFRPEEKPGEILVQNGLTYVNTYYPPETKSLEGDVSIFLEFLNKLLPDEHDRLIMLSYMAACVQNPGVKFQWAPLVQGVEGNGKTFLATTMTHALGEAYTHTVNPQDLSSRFTGWLDRKLLIIVEEVYLNGKLEAQEALKPLITNARVEIQFKQGNQFTGDNRANFFLFSNYKDAVKKSPADRRYCVLYSAQQSKHDLERDGMSGPYFPELYRWARADGFAYINHYLQNFNIPSHLNPADLCHRAPITSSTNEAIKISVASEAQEILEAIKENQVGFRGGWISSVAIDILFKRKNLKVPLNKRRLILEEIHYLPVRRLNKASPVDGGKRPMLYASLERRDLLNMKNSMEITASYLEAQGLKMTAAGSWESSAVGV